MIYLNNLNNLNKNIKQNSDYEHLLNLFYNANNDLPDEMLFKMIKSSWEVNKILTYKIVAYLRDYKNGKGYRYCFRKFLIWLANNDKDNLIKNLYNFINKFGRYDDLFYLLNTKCENSMFNIIEYQLNKDLFNFKQNKNISLLIKWLPSENKKFDKKTGFYKKLLKHMKMSAKSFRQLYISPLRKYLNLIETNICQNKINEIDLYNIPSTALKKYSKYKTSFLQKNLCNKLIHYNKLINSFKTLLPNQIISHYISHNDTINIKNFKNHYYENEWNSIKEKFKNDYYNDIKNTIIMCDTSPSMNGNLSYISFAITLLISELSNDIFKNLILSFETKPHLYEIIGDSLIDKINSLKECPWDMKIDTMNALRLILKNCIINNINKGDEPKNLLIITDVNFDNTNNNKYTDFLFSYEEMDIIFNSYGYNVPKITFWNLKENIYNDVEKYTNGFIDSTGAISNKTLNSISFVYGFSLEILKSVLQNKKTNAYYNMIQNIEKEYYDCINVNS